MDVTQTQPAFGTTAANSTETSARSNISSDFDTFLQMLTVQLQNQDPLNPVDSADYAVQLATFSGVEQQVQTNELLTQIVAENSAAGLAQLAGWVGNEARVPAYGHWGGSPVTIVPEITSGADGAQLLVRDQNGTEVARRTITTDGSAFEWDGKANDGSTLPYGTYQFDTVSYSGTVPISESPAEVYSRVAEVRTVGGVSSIVLQGGAVVPSSDVTALRAPNN